jgi:hypothetical protein
MLITFTGRQSGCTYTTPVGNEELDGTLYEYGENLGAKGYPLSRDLHCYTYNGTDNRESAFINMILSEFGQTGQVVTPEMLVEALAGAQALYQVKRQLRLADREVEKICRAVGLYDELKNGTGKLDEADVERRVREAVA